MPSNRSVSPGEEPVEFRPLAGQEGEWAGADYLCRSPLWTALGLYPIAAYVVILLAYLGVMAA